MKFLEKLGLVLFSNMILILSVLFLVVIFRWVDSAVLQDWTDYIMRHGWATNLVIILCTAFILLAIKCIFFGTGDDEEGQNGILVETEEGKLLISRDTIENIVNGVVRGFDAAKDVISKITFDAEKKIIVQITLYISQDAIIKELTSNIQLKVKEAVKKSSDLDVKEVNVKVKNVYTKKVVE